MLCGQISARCVNLTANARVSAVGIAAAALYYAQARGDLRMLEVPTNDERADGSSRSAFVSRDSSLCRERAN